MKTYKVTLSAELFPDFVVEVDSETDDGAVEKAFEVVECRRWLVRNYKLKQLERLV